MEDFSASSGFFSQRPNHRSFKGQPAPRHIARLALTGLVCETVAALLLVFLSCSLFLFSLPAPASAAPGATTCPTSNLPPTPTAGAPFDPNNIKINELLTNPKKDWNCDGKINNDDAWIELINLSSSDASLLGLQLCCDVNNQALLLPTTNRIAAHSFFVIFRSQIHFTSFTMSPNGGTLELLASQGNAIDTVGYPALGPDQSYLRDSSGQWTICATATLNTPNTCGGGPTPTSTKRSSGGGGSGGGGGGGGGGAPTATPTPLGSVFIPTDTPDLAFPGTGNGSSGGNSGGNTALPSWLKITLLAAMGAGLLAVVVWYIRSWGKESESET